MLVSNNESPSTASIDECGPCDVCTMVDLDDLMNYDWNDPGWHAERLERVTKIRVEELAAQQQEWDKEREEHRLHWKDEIEEEKPKHIRAEQGEIAAPRLSFV